MSVEQVLKRIEKLKDEAVELERTLTAFKAMGPENGGDGEHKKAEFLKEKLTEIGFYDIIEIKAPDNRVTVGYRPNVVGIYPGKSHDKKVWIMTHMDVVPPGDLSLWKSDPWKVWIDEEGRIYGRGVEDNQQDMVASLLAIQAYAMEGITPEYDVGLVFVADEETGSDYGIKYVLKHKKNLFSKDDLIIVPDGGNPDGTEIEVAEKGILWIKFAVKGKQTHASTPERGINAHKAGANLIVRLEKLYELFPASDPLFEPPTSTFEPTKKEANVPNINTIPGEDIFYFDCRIMPQYPLEKVKEQVRKIVASIESDFGVKIEISYPQEAEAAPPTPTDAPVVKAIQKAVKELRGLDAKPVGIGGGTVAAHFREAGFYAAVWATMDETMHSPNEYAWLKNIIEDAKVFAYIMGNKIE
ncbi:MAG: M20 family metallo-hydrolase [Candidatus Aminicenantes bacterium]|nr:M20 family metallo-hydrolase [Candidatus Aminicenantes bacterium]